MLRLAMKTIDPVTKPAATGKVNCLRNASTLVCRQPKSGPAPIKIKRIRKSGPLTLLKKGAATLIRLLEKISLNMGKKVPHNVAKAMAVKIQLFAIKAASRLAYDSIVCSSLSSGRREKSK